MIIKRRLFINKKRVIYNYNIEQSNQLIKKGMFPNLILRQTKQMMTTNGVFLFLKMKKDYWKD